MWEKRRCALSGTLEVLLTVGYGADELRHSKHEATYSVAELTHESNTARFNSYEA